MGIKGLKKLIADHAPSAFRDHALESYFGRRIAVDASMHIYQFMAVVGRQGDQLLTNDAGEVTSHLLGMMYRTARLLESGVKPVYVFDGKPPQMKSDELAKRGAARHSANQQLKEAKERGDAEAIEKFSKRTIRVTREHNEECKRLLRLMGVPILEAPCEAEAQCAELCKGGKVYSVATEDMDCLTFGSTRQSRNMMAPQSQKKDIQEFDVAKVLEGLEVTMEQFVDICILCGCDYCGTIRGIGPKKSLDLIKKHGSIEKVIEALDTTKYVRSWPSGHLHPPPCLLLISLPLPLWANLSDAIFHVCLLLVFIPSLSLYQVPGAGPIPLRGGQEAVQGRRGDAIGSGGPLCLEDPG